MVTTRYVRVKLMFVASIKLSWCKNKRHYKSRTCVLDCWFSPWCLCFEEFVLWQNLFTITDEKGFTILKTWNYFTIPIEKMIFFSCCTRNTFYLETPLNIASHYETHKHFFWAGTNPLLLKLLLLMCYQTCKYSVMCICMFSPELLPALAVDMTREKCLTVSWWGWTAWPRFIIWLYWVSSLQEGCCPCLGL